MRKAFIVIALVAIAAPLAAQNTDIESMSGLQFNFGNPGARALGMGGAFLGLADDASAAEANPAGLTILRKPEVTLEARNYLEEQVLTTSGTYPDVERTAFSHNSDRVVVSFASFVYPVKNFTLGLYYHEPLRNQGAGVVLPQRNPYTGRVEKQVPLFYWSRDQRTPVTLTQCQELRKADPASCPAYSVNPFISAVDVQQRTWGFAGAWQMHPKFSVGATVRYQTFMEEALTYRVDPFGNFSSIAVQATGTTDGLTFNIKQETDITFGVGFKYAPTDKLSFGGVYKRGPEFDAPVFIANSATQNLYAKQAETKFHIPDVMGVGVSFRPIPVLTVNADAVHVKYSNLVDDFFATNAEIRAQGAPFEAKDVTELRFGAEYFFATRIPFALRAGYWRDPAHATQYTGEINVPEAVAETILFPEGEDQNHFSIGGGIAFPRFSVDFAYDTSDHYKVGSISLVTRF